jgi:hypothetical protein
MFRTKFVNKIKINILFLNLIFFDRASLLPMVEKEAS